MLIVKYLGIPAPFTPFYLSGLDALNDTARSRFEKPFPALQASDAHAVVEQMAKGEMEAWSGPPSPLFFFTLRNDALDVTYGTVSGFETLAVPYMPHIAPLSRWGE